MSLKDLTKDSHDRAEQTAFMKAVFAGTLPLDIWADFTFQKASIYNAIENIAREAGLLTDLAGIERARLLLNDAKEMNPTLDSLNPVAHDYVQYLISIKDYPERIMAHLYTWHMGDLFGGQMIKKVIDAPHTALDFANADLLKNAIRAKLDDTMAVEANVAFDWAIQLMEQYSL